MKDLEFTVEDYLETLVGLRTDEKFKIDRSDINFVGSIGRQVFKGIGLTDRQHTVIKEKLMSYRKQFNEYGYTELENNLDNLRIPVRNIDRSRWIKIVNSLGNDSVYESHASPFIAVRFSFQKKLISALEHLNTKLQTKPYHYDKLNKIQYYEYNERNLYEIVTAFKDKNFELDETVESLYQKISSFKEEDVVPGIFNYEIKNLNATATKMIEDELGKPNKDNILLYKDRTFKYGLHRVDHVQNDNSLEARIAHRRTPSVQVSKDTYHMDTLLLALENLKRYPILVIVPSTMCYDAVVSTHSYIKNLIPSNEISVTFRMDNQGEGIEFNKYIKRECINNLVDTDTKIVYNLDTKVPKPLINSGWKPSTILVVGSTGLTSTRKVLDLYPGVDLTVYHIDGNSPGYSRYMRRDMESI